MGVVAWPLYLYDDGNSSTADVQRFQLLCLILLTGQLEFPDLEVLFPPRRSPVVVLALLRFENSLTTFSNRLRSEMKRKRTPKQSKRISFPLLSCLVINKTRATTYVRFVLNVPCCFIDPEVFQKTSSVACLL